MSNSSNRTEKGLMMMMMMIMVMVMVMVMMVVGGGVMMMMMMVVVVVVVMIMMMMMMMTFCQHQLGMCTPSVALQKGLCRMSLQYSCTHCSPLQP